MLHSKINVFLNIGSPRSILAKKHIIFTFLLKGISIIIGLAYVPLLIDYLDAERYGLWLTLSSIITWFSFFNLGLGNGLRNNFTKALANNEKVLAKKLVSTTYAILSIIFGIVIIIFWGINHLLNWSKILNTTIIAESELSLLALIVFTFFCLRFIFDLIAVIIRADQRPSLASSFGPIGNIIVLSIIYILMKVSSTSSLIVLGSLLSITPVLVLLLASIILFKGRYKEYKPTIKDVELLHAKDLMSLGLKFFIIQVAALIFFSSSNIIITQVLGAKEVTIYNIAFKYFSIPIMILSTIMTPIWSAVTDAYHKNDFEWLKKTLKKLNILSILLVVCILIMAIFSGFAYKHWIGDRIEIPFFVTLAMSLYAIIKTILTPYSNYINGLGKLQLSIYVVITKATVFIPMAILLAKSPLGISGVILASCIINMSDLIFQPKQVHKILNHKAHGIWGK